MAAASSIITSHKNLSDREKDILRTIIHMYILNALPVGSRTLSKYLEHELKLSPATLRNIMSDLEEMEYISHPHTSAGRIPTDKGYRYYVDTLMQTELLSEHEIQKLIGNVATITPDNVLKDASKLLGMLSRCLGVVAIPHFTDLAIQKIELISLASNRVLVVIALDSKIVRTVTLEAEFEIQPSELEKMATFMNEKVSGKSLKFVEDNFQAMVSEGSYGKAPLIRLFVDSIDKLFESYASTDRIHITGTQHMLDYPEFEDVQRVKSVIELVENEDVIIHILDKIETEAGEPRILIGSEMHNQLLDDYSLIVTTYRMGNAEGSIGLIGPKRMNYSRLTSLVQYVGELISIKNK